MTLKIRILRSLRSFFVIFVNLTKNVIENWPNFYFCIFFSKFVASLFWCYYTTTAALAVLYSGPAVSTIILERFLNAKCQFVIYHNFFVEQTAAQLSEIVSGGACKFFVSKHERRKVHEPMLGILAAQPGPNGRLSCLHSFKIFWPMKPSYTSN